MAKNWQNVLRALGTSDPLLIHQSPYDNNRRTYETPEGILKIQFGRGLAQRQTLTEESKVLQRAAGIKGIPKVISLSIEDDFEALLMEKIRGYTPRGHITFLRTLGLVARCAMMLARLSLRGIVHNDLRIDNVLVGARGSAHLVDFDRSTTASGGWALIANFTGRGPGARSSQYSFPNLILTLIKQSVPDKMKRVVVRLVRKDGDGLHPPSDDPLARFERLTESSVSALQEAWTLAARSDASSPGRQVAYYSLRIGDRALPGERPWEDRWRALEHITDYGGKTTLELGCNLGLLSTTLRLEKNTRTSYAVDHDENILDAAQMISDALGADVRFSKVDLDANEEWERALVAVEPDIVFALNVLNWVQQKERLLRFLSRAPEVIFEGHDAVETEIGRFESLGFDVTFLGLTERARPLLHCRSTG